MRYLTFLVFCFHAPTLLLFDICLTYALPYVFIYIFMNDNYGTNLEHYMGEQGLALLAVKGF